MILVQVSELEVTYSSTYWIYASTLELTGTRLGRITRALAKRQAIREAIEHIEKEESPE